MNFENLLLIIIVFFFKFPFSQDPAVEKKVNIQKLLEDVRKGSPAVREEATDKLRELGPAAKGAVPALLEILLNEKDLEIRECAGSILIHIGEGAAPARTKLFQFLKNPQEHKEIRRMAAAALGEMGKEGLPFLCNCLKDPDPFVRKEGAENFWRLGPLGLPNVSLLIQALEDDDIKVREFAQGSLGTWGKPVLPKLHASLGYLKTEGRISACAAILYIDRGDPVALNYLAKELKNPDVFFRREAALILSNRVFTGWPEYSKPDPRWKTLVKPFREALKDSNEKIREMAASALGDIQLDPELVIPALIKSLHDPNENVRVQTAVSLGQFQEKAAPAIGELIKALDKDTYSVRLAAIQALEEIGPLAQGAVSLIQKALKDPDNEMRSRAKDALRKIQKSIRGSKGNIKEEGKRGRFS